MGILRHIKNMKIKTWICFFFYIDVMLPILDKNNHFDYFSSCAELKYFYNSKLNFNMRNFVFCKIVYCTK